MAKRIEWVDSAKGIAILAVIVGHTLGPYTNGLFGSFIFAFHMPIFFVLSGFLYHPRPPKQEAKRGMVNLLLPYVSTSGLILMVNWLALKLPSNPLLNAYFPSTKRGIVAVLYGAGSEVFNPWGLRIAPIGAIWFLLSMFLAIQIFNLLMTRTHDLKHAVLVQLLIVVLLAGLGGLLGRIAYLPWAINAALLSQAFLYAGHLIKKTALLGRIRTSWYLVLLALWIVSAAQGYFVLTVPASPNLVISVVGGIAASLCLIRFCAWLSRFKGRLIMSWLESCGRYSLIVLCFHLIDLDVIGLQGWLFNGTMSVIGPWWATVIAILYRVVFATLWVGVIPKVPGLRVCYLPRKYLVQKVDVQTG